MKTKTKRARSSDRRAALPRGRAVREQPVRKEQARKEQSPTAVAAEALRTGVLPPVRREKRQPAFEEAIRVGDPDDDIMENVYVGEDTPGASTPTPDQNAVDDIGRAYGLQEEDTGALRSADEVLSRRDRHRVELRAPAKPED
jgi:hypothetical protein